MTPGPKLRRLLQEDSAAFDAAFDTLLPLHVQRMSRLHWTPTEAVKIAVDLFQPRAGESFLDVGSGPGKFCVIASLLSEASFVGVERSPSLVEIATSCASTLETRNAKFICGDAFVLDWTPFSGVYLYNPFEDPLFGQSLEQTRETYGRETTARLAQMSPGARVVLHNAFGGEVPGDYVRSRSQAHGSGALELWTKEAR